jgi:hypothetical protein
MNMTPEGACGADCTDARHDGSAMATFPCSAAKGLSA